MTATIAKSPRLRDLEAHGRIYAFHRLALAWTDGLHGTAAKVARNWQTRPMRLRDERYAAGLMRRGLTCNPVISLRASNLIGIDVDGAAGRALLAELVPGGLPPTITVRTGRPDGGTHYWYRPPDGTWPHKIEFGEELALPKDGYLVAPPAIHGETGLLYVFEPGRAPWEHRITTLPAEILKTLTGHARKRDQAERGDDDGDIPQGHRHRRLCRLAGAMRRVGAGQTTIVAALLAENTERCKPPMEEQAIRDLAKDIVDRYKPQ